MVTRFQTAIRQGGIDVTGFPGQPRVARGFRIVAQPRPGVFATRDQLNRAIARARQTGVFRASEFIGTFKLSNVGVFDPQAARARALAQQKLTPTTIRVLETQGILKPRFETRAGIVVKPKPETLAQRSSRLARERRTTRTFGRVIPSARKLRVIELERARQFFRKKGGPLAIGVTLEQLKTPFLEEFNVLFTPKIFSSNQLDVLSRKLDIEGRKLDNRIKEGTATQAQINKFNVLITQFGKQASRTQAKQFRRLFKERPAPLKPIKKIRPQDFGKFVGNLTIEDVIPKEFGGRGASFFESGNQVADFLENLSRTGRTTRRFSKTVTIRGEEKPRLSLVRGAGNIIGGAFAVFETVQRAVVFGAQEAFRQRFGDRVEFVIPKKLAFDIRSAAKKDLIIFTNPLRFVKVNDNKFVLTPRAVGETFGLGFDIMLLISPVKGVGKIIKVVGNRAVSVVGNFRLAKVPVNIGFFSKIKVGSLSDVAQITARGKFTNRFRVPSEFRFARKIPPISEIPRAKRVLGPRVTRKVGVEDIFKLSDEQLLKEINAFGRLTKTRKLAVIKPGKIEILQNQVFELRQKFTPKRIKEPISKNINTLKKEIQGLENLSDLRKLRSNVFTLRSNFRVSIKQLPSGSFLIKRINFFLKQSAPGKRIKGVFATEREISRLKKLISRGTFIEKRILKFSKGELVFNKARRLRNLIENIIIEAKKSNTPLVLKKEKIIFAGKFRIPLTIKQHIKLLNLLKQKIRRGIDRPKIGRKRAGLESTLFDSRSRIDALLGTKINLLVNKPVPRNFRRLQALVKETAIELKKIRFEKTEVLRVSKQKTVVKNEVLNLKNELQVGLREELPLSLKDLRKLLNRLRGTKAGRAFRRRTKVTRIQRRQQLTLLREREELFRLTKKRQLTNREANRVVSLNKKISSLSSGIRKAEKPLKPIIVAKKRVVQIIKLKKRIVKKRVRKIEIPAGDIKPGFRFAPARQKNFTDVIEEFYTFPVGVPKGVIGRSESFVVRTFGRLVTTPGTRLFILTIGNLRLFSRTSGILRVLLANKFRFTPRVIALIRAKINDLTKLKEKAAERLKFKAIQRIIEREKIRAVTLLKLKKRPPRVRIPARKPPRRKPPRKPPKKRPPRKPLRKPPIKPLPVFLPSLNFPQNITRLTKLKAPVNLFIRRGIRGKVRPIQVNKVPLFANQAAALGRSMVDNDSSRTFFLRVAAKGKPRKIKVPKAVSRKRFRSPKGKTQLQLGSRVEKIKHAISSRKEKREITAKGIRASRRRKREKRKKRRKKTKRKTKRRKR